MTIPIFRLIAPHSQCQAFPCAGKIFANCLFHLWNFSLLKQDSGKVTLCNICGKSGSSCEVWSKGSPKIYSKHKKTWTIWQKYLSIVSNWNDSNILTEREGFRSESIASCDVFFSIFSTGRERLSHSQYLFVFLNAIGCPRWHWCSRTPRRSWRTSKCKFHLL